jgi:pimeloyl-ACP methyl ester carboxylesterase
VEIPGEGGLHSCPGERWDQQYAHAMAETSYAKCGDLSIAYQVFGDGPVELVVAGSFASHIELYWTMPEFVAVFERISTFCRVLLFDKAGVGLSDPVPHVRTLDDRAAEIEAVMDAVGFERAVLFGGSESGPVSIFFAATRPERTRALILTGTFAYFGFDGWDDLERDPADLRARLVPELGDDYTPSTEQLARWQTWCRAAGSTWGSGEALKALLPSRSGSGLLTLTSVQVMIATADENAMSVSPTPPLVVLS